MFSVRLSPFSSIRELPSPCFGGACVPPRVGAGPLKLCPFGVSATHRQLGKGQNRREVLQTMQAILWLIFQVLLRTGVLLRDVGSYADRKELRPPQGA